MRVRPSLDTRSERHAGRAIAIIGEHYGRDEGRRLFLISLKDLRRVSSALPMLRIVENELGNDFARHATLARIPTGRDVMVEGDRAEAVPLLISGQICVFPIGESGREITLYGFGQGAYARTGSRAA